MKKGSFDWRSLKRYFSPQATQDLNHFLENLPQQTGNAVLIVAAVIWSVAGGLGLYTFVQSRSLAELRAQLADVAAVQPTVPQVRNVAESTANVEKFVEAAAVSYPDLDMKPNGSSIYIAADDTRFFPQFREAVGHVQNGGRGWRVNIEELCVGRECPQKPLSIRLKVNRVSIE